MARTDFTCRAVTYRVEARRGDVDISFDITDDGRLIDREAHDSVRRRVIKDENPTPNIGCISIGSPDWKSPIDQ
jgi:hypothetical protein